MSSSVARASPPGLGTSLSSLFMSVSFSSSSGFFLLAWRHKADDRNEAKKANWNALETTRGITTRQHTLTVGAEPTGPLRSCTRTACTRKKKLRANTRRPTSRSVNAGHAHGRTPKDTPKDAPHLVATPARGITRFALGLHALGSDAYSLGQGLKGRRSCHRCMHPHCENPASRPRAHAPAHPRCCLPA